MEKQIQVWKFISDSLFNNISVVLLYVLESTGSSPGRQGFFMAVNSYGEMEGSIGGGIMEYKFVEMAKSKFKEEYYFRLCCNDTKWNWKTYKARQKHFIYKIN